MRIRHWLGLLLAAPLASGHAPQKRSLSLGGYETMSPEDFDQLLTHVPSCALSCLTKIIPNTPCTFGDLPCMCDNEKYTDAATICIRADCKISEALKTMNLTEIACGRPKRDVSAQYTSMNIVSGVFTIILVIARLFFKRFLSGSGQIGLDDWTILAATLIAFPGIIVNQVGLVGHGIGKDIWTLPASELPLFAKFFFIMELFYLVDMSLVKLSLSLFYLYVFPGPKIRLLLIGTAIFNAVFGIVFVIAALAQCIPLDYYWSQYYDYPPEGRCFDLNRFAWANAGLNLMTDVWMIMIPMVQIGKLKLHWRKKMGVIVMFILGTFVSIISIIRLRSVIFFAKIINPTWDQWNVAWWSTMEVNIGIICTCLPTVRLMLKRMFPNLLSAGDENNTDAGSPRTGNGSPREEAQRPAFPIELSTATLVTDTQSNHKRFDSQG